MKKRNPIIYRSPVFTLDAPNYRDLFRSNHICNTAIRWIFKIQPAHMFITARYRRFPGSVPVFAHRCEMGCCLTINTIRKPVTFTATNLSFPNLFRSWALKAILPGVDPIKLYLRCHPVRKPSRRKATKQKKG